MLHSLHISHYILIDSLDITFPEGLVIVTGQTGAGKSILLGALSLLAGSKADASVISDGADSCVVEAEFKVADNDALLKETLEENDAEWEGGSILIRRVVSRSGRSRCFVNDSPVPVQALADLSARLIDIHSQHRSLLLTDHAFQLSILDSIAGSKEDLASCKDAWNRLQAARKELASLGERLSALNAESDYNASQYSQLEAAGLREGEMEELEQEQSELANAELIKSCLGAAEELILPSDDNSSSMDSALKEARRQLEHAGRFVPAAIGLSERIESCRIELDDIVGEISSRNAGIGIDEKRLQEVEERMSLLYSLFRKHSCQTVEELMAVRDSLGRSLCDTDALSSRMKDLEKEIARLEKDHGEACIRLHESRAAAAPKFSHRITESLGFLELDRAVFQVELAQSAPGPSGFDSAIFKFSATGTSPVDVAKCASGGELSRIMLSLKQMMARFEGMPTMIFDEIDTGVSGSVADKMGQMICEMGEWMQVFSITHLPQVAAKGKAHYVVTKTVSEGRATSHMERVEGDARVMEIARLLSGASVTEAAVANAKSLLDGH